MNLKSIKILVVGTSLQPEKKNGVKGGLGSTSWTPPNTPTPATPRTHRQYLSARVEHPYHPRQRWIQTTFISLIQRIEHPRTLRKAYHHHNTESNKSYVLNTLEHIEHVLNTYWTSTACKIAINTHFCHSHWTRPEHLRTLYNPC